MFSKVILTPRNRFDIIDFRFAVFVLENVQFANVQYGGQDAPHRVQLTVGKLQHVFHASQQFFKIFHVGLGMSLILAFRIVTVRQVTVTSVIVQSILFEHLVGFCCLQEVVENVKILLFAVSIRTEK